MNIGILIPTTSNKRDWGDISESYLFTVTLKTFLLTYDKEHLYRFYIGIDKDDPIFDNKKQQQKLLRFIEIMHNVSLEFVLMDDIKI